MIAVIDYKAGNAPSVLSALKHIGADGRLVKTPEELRSATHIILPGVGAAAATMDSLRESGFIPAFEELVLGGGIPFLGICVGMQVLFERSEEGGDVPCLGWLKGRVRRYDDKAVKVPQIGWNRTVFTRDTAMTRRGGEGYFYFVNSYYVDTPDETIILGQTDYCGTFTSMINRDNIYATQFHTEKSGEAGLSMLRGFCGVTE